MRVGAQRVPGDVLLHAMDHAGDGRGNGVVAAQAGIAQNTVARMIIGGSSGLRTRIALPRSAPPTFSIAREVVTVNSSMLARVPAG